jgi:prepilin-type N-terminal cleavage/methylation domain-containing protein/prepilin-type processing-associated H-X9-DG protein
MIGGTDARTQQRIEGFTLIELLVVIAIIALLMAVLTPVLNRARQQARAAVCLATLKQWGLCYQLYGTDHDSKLPYFRGGTVHTTYMESLRPYYSDINKMRTCPAATKVSTGNPTGLQAESYFGYTRFAWQIDVAQAEWMAETDWGIGSFGENSSLRNSVDQSGNRTNPDRTWATLDVRNVAAVPLIADARWNNAWPQNSHPVPAEVASEEQMYALSNWSQIVCYAMRRHRGGVNVCFGDGTARGVRAEALWALKWHRQSEPHEVGDALDWMKNW